MIFSANKPDAPNPAIASRFHVGHHWRRVGDPGRSAAGDAGTFEQETTEGTERGRIRSSVSSVTSC